MPEYLLAVTPPPQCNGPNDALQWDGVQFVCRQIGVIVDDVPPAPIPPTSGTIVQVGTPAGLIGFTNTFTTIDRWHALPNGATVTRLGIYQTNARNFSLVLARENAGGSYDILVNVPINHPGGGNAFVLLSPAFVVPASGVIRIGAFNNVTGQHDATDVSPPRAWKVGNQTGSGTTGWTADFGYAWPLRYELQ